MKMFKGTIVSHATNKTAVVRVDRLKLHPKYEKYYRVSQKFKAHDEKNEFRQGDTVMIQETRPRSRDKRWQIVQLVRRPEPENFDNRPAA